MSNNLQKDYLEANVRTASPLELVLMMYDILTSDMRHACAAIQNSDIEMRTHHVRHALLVVQQLNAALNFKEGGEAAKLLGHFYSYLRAKLLEAQIRASGSIIENLIQQVTAVKKQWLAFMPNERNIASSLPEKLMTSDSSEHTMQWSV